MNRGSEDNIGVMKRKMVLNGEALVYHSVYGWVSSVGGFTFGLILKPRYFSA